MSDDELEFIFKYWNPGANHDNSRAGAFFTPLSLASEFAFEVAGSFNYRRGRVVDLCAGIGALSYSVLQRVPDMEIVCVETNPDYLAVGKKILPQAKWVCADVMDRQAMRELGCFDLAYSNPPFGAVSSMKSKSGKYTGGKCEYKVIDVASTMADSGIFIIPQMSAPFRYSGMAHFTRDESEAYQRFCRETGIELEAGIGVDTSDFEDDWIDVSVRVEIVTAEFPRKDVNAGLPVLDKVIKATEFLHHEEQEPCGRQVEEVVQPVIAGSDGQLDLFAA